MLDTMEIQELDLQDYLWLGPGPILYMYFVII